MQQLAGRVAVVTGAGSGIGRALAVRFAEEGMSVAALDVDQLAAAGTATIAAHRHEQRAKVGGTESGGTVLRALPLQVDVADDEAMAAAADQVFAELGGVDVVCLNAGIFTGGFLWERPKADLDHILGVNLHGVLNGIRHFVPRMIDQDTDGHIVTTASVAGLFGSPYSGPYGVSKFAAFAAGETLAHDLIAAGTKLRASVLCPGIVRTDIARRARDREPLPGTETSEAQRFVNEVLVDVVESGGIHPDEVADRVVQAILDEQFLVLTHDHHADAIRDRAETLAKLELPPIIDYT